MATTTATANLGDVVVFHPSVDLGRMPRAALVIEAHDDGTADLRVYNGYAQGTTDFQKVAPFDPKAEDPDAPQPRTFQARADFQKAAAKDDKLKSEHPDKSQTHEAHKAHG
jgi:hypothetical protein